MAKCVPALVLAALACAVAIGPVPAPGAPDTTGTAGADGTVRPAALPAATGRCEYPAKPVPGRPWALQRVQLDRLWEDTRGEGVRVAVVDSGVDVENPQLEPAVDVDAGADLRSDEEREQDVPEGPTTDLVGHGTKVAGIIAARPSADTGFVGLAPEATVVPIRQTDGAGKALALAESVDHAVDQNADVINISSDTEGALGPGTRLHAAVQRALDADIVVVASAGNDGADGRSRKTYPASYEGVLAVAASDRNNERARFSQSGDFVGIAAPGVDIVSTVPGGGHCLDNGTSFAAPYVAGVAALLRAKHADWSRQEIVAQIQHTAERAVSGRDRHIGWGVVDPVRALTEDAEPVQQPSARDGVRKAPEPEPAALHLGETYAERNERIGTYVLLAGAVLVSMLTGASLVHRDWRRRRHPGG